MYIRFAVSKIDDDSGRGAGIFQAAFDLESSGLLYPGEWEALHFTRMWFNENLERPSRFTNSKPPYYRKPSKAICWFKDSACEHIARARILIEIVRNHDVEVRTLITGRVGYVVYEDLYQVAAEPFADTKC
jgi:hypothetical protein